MSEKPTFWQWLKNGFKKETLQKVNIYLQFLASFPIMETMLGCFVLVFSLGWQTVPLIGTPLGILQAIGGALLMLHSWYRGEYT